MDTFPDHRPFPLSTSPLFARATLTNDHTPPSHDSYDTL